LEEALRTKNALANRVEELRKENIKGWENPFAQLAEQDLYKGHLEQLKAENSDLRRKLLEQEKLLLI
jgi:hypothetical protein